MGVASICKKCEFIHKTGRNMKALSAGGKATDRTSNDKLTSYSNTADYRLVEHAYAISEGSV